MEKIQVLDIYYLNILFDKQSKSNIYYKINGSTYNKDEMLPQLKNNERSSL
jgi:hypothetical protein